MTVKPKIVLLGMLTKMPVAGVTWLVAQYAIGLRRLGFDVYYVEAHARTPSMFMQHPDDDPTAKAVAFLRAELGKFGLQDRWALHALHEDGACYGMTWPELKRLYNEAALIINMHGGTMPLEEHAATQRLVFLGTDPGEVEFEIERADPRALAALDMHSWFFTWGLNYGNPDCKLPWSTRFGFAPSPPPVVMDMWESQDIGPGNAMTTVGNWRQPWRNMTIDGEVYRWSKHYEFLKLIELPQRVAQPFELALGSYGPDDQSLLETNGWAVRPATEVSRTSDAYRAYIASSRGEFTVAKDQNIRFRSGWFSERSACYLAAGRPVIMQDTGFGSYLPTGGGGLLSFSDLDSAVAAVERVNGDYDRHRAAASDIARTYLDSDVVLRSLLDHCGVTAPVQPRPNHTVAPLPHALDLAPVSRRPLRLPDATSDAVLMRPVPRTLVTGAARASIVMVVHDSLDVTRMAVESILSSTADVTYEIIIVDNASAESTAQYLDVVASRNNHVTVIHNDVNLGFAAGTNRGLERARGEALVLVNSDIIVTPGWLRRLLSHLDAPGVGAVGPVTNRCGNHAEVTTHYRTYGEMAAFVEERHAEFLGETTSLPMLVMFCMALRRNVYEAVGPLDEGFGIGMFEDDDYGRRLHEHGSELVCAEDVFVHHFGEASFSRLYADGARSRLFDANRERFESKWSTAWSPHSRRPSRSYDNVVDDIRATLSHLIACDAVVAVVSRGDQRLVEFGMCTARHFPCAPDGTFAGHYPADDAEAIEMVRANERTGLTHLVFPESAFWWLSHYTGLRRFLDDHYTIEPTASPNLLVFTKRSVATVGQPVVGKGIGVGEFASHT